MTSSQPGRIHEVFPYLRTRDAAAAVEFYQQAFGAEELFRLAESGGRIGHAELKFGAATVMVSDEYPEYGIHAPRASVPTGSAITCTWTTWMHSQSGPPPLEPPW